jgi:phosphoglycolate phosphatase
MLVLFDVDGTLLLTHRAGLLAMQDAGRELFGESFTFEGVEFAGRLDPLIWSSVAEQNGIADTPEHHERFRATYGECLRRRLDADPTAELLPGVAALVDRLHRRDDVTLGLLTGNYPETGRLKIERAGLDPAIFVIRAWGDDGRHRRDLPAVAIRRYQQRIGRPVEPHRTIIIGDTPHDIDCAHANGCRAIGVATGPVYTIDDLRSHDPELAVEDLSDTDRLVDWILTPAAEITE